MSADAKKTNAAEPNEPQGQVLPPTAIEQHVLSASELAAQLGISTSSVQNHLVEKGCPYWAAGNRKKFVDVDVYNWIRENLTRRGK